MANKIELGTNISEYLYENFGPEFLDKYKEHIATEFHTFIRLSELNSKPEVTLKNLEKYGIKTTPVKSIKNAYIVTAGLDYIGKTLEFIQGYYYIQSLSSMIPPIILNPDENDIVLDLCAAPGSKSTQLAEMMNNRGTLYVNEPNLNRIKSLMFNIDKMGFSNVGAIKNKGELLSKFFNSYFDKILVDAPCSGLGILQKKGEVSNWWTHGHAEKLSELQFRILLSAVKMLKPGGELVYSTCTMTLEENELTLNNILKKYPLELIDIELPVKSYPAYTEYNNEKLNPNLAKAHRIIPWEVESEGFFVAKFKKTGEMPASKQAQFKKESPEFFSANNKNIKKYLARLSDYFGIDKSVFELFKYQIKKNDIFIIGSDWKVDNLNIFLRAGRKFGIIDKRDLAHLHSNSIQSVAKYITRNILDITDDHEMRTYLNGGIIKKDFGEYGQKAIRYNGIIVGTGISTDGGLKSQFPKNLRTHEIILPSEIK